MSATSDFVASLCAELDVVTESLISNLITAKASDHDTLAGQIRGIAKARKIVNEHARKFQAAVDDDEIDAFKRPHRNQPSLNLTIA